MSHNNTVRLNKWCRTLHCALVCISVHLQLRLERTLRFVVLVCCSNENWQAALSCHCTYESYCVSRAQCTLRSRQYVTLEFIYRLTYTPSRRKGLETHNVYSSFIIMIIIIFIFFYVAYVLFLPYYFSAGRQYTQPQHIWMFEHDQGHCICERSIRTKRFKHFSYCCLCCSAAALLLLCCCCLRCFLKGDYERAALRVHDEQ